MGRKKLHIVSLKEEEREELGSVAYAGVLRGCCSAGGC